MPPGMLQQMQRQMRGGGLQEMMKAMMRGQGGDQFDMEEMQRTYTSLSSLHFTYQLILARTSRYDVANGKWDGRPRWPRGRYAEYVGHVQDDGYGRRRRTVIFLLKN